MGLRKLSIDNFSDHSMDCYIANIRKWQELSDYWPK